MRAAPRQVIDFDDIHAADLACVRLGLPRAVGSEHDRADRSPRQRLDPAMPTRRRSSTPYYPFASGLERGRFTSARVPRWADLKEGRGSPSAQVQRAYSGSGLGLFRGFCPPGGQDHVRDDRRQQPPTAFVGKQEQECKGG